MIVQRMQTVNCDMIVTIVYLYFSFPPPFVSKNDSVDWLYSAAMTSWRNWLPQDTENTILRFIID